MQFARDVVGSRQSVNITKLEDPSTVTLRGLRLDNLPLWLARMLLTEKRLRDVKHVVATDCSGITDALVELLCGNAPGLMSLRVVNCGSALRCTVDLPAALEELVLVGVAIDDDAATAICAVHGAARAALEALHRAAQPTARRSRGWPTCRLSAPASTTRRSRRSALRRQSCARSTSASVTGCARRR